MAEVPITAVSSAFQSFPCLPPARFPVCIESPLLCPNGLPEPGHLFSCPSLRSEYISSLPFGAGLRVEIPSRQIPVGCRSWEAARPGHPTRPQNLSQPLHCPGPGHLLQVALPRTECSDSSGLGGGSHPARTPDAAEGQSREAGPFCNDLTILYHRTMCIWMEEPLHREREDSLHTLVREPSMKSCPPRLGTLRLQ